MSLGNHHHHPSPEHFHLPKVKLHAHQTLTPALSHPHHSLSVSMNLTSWEWFLLYVGTECSSVVTLLWNDGANQWAWGDESDNIPTFTFKFFNKQLSFCFSWDNYRIHGRLWPQPLDCVTNERTWELVFKVHFHWEDLCDKSPLTTGWFLLHFQPQGINSIFYRS